MTTRKAPKKPAAGKTAKVTAAHEFMAELVRRPGAFMRPVDNWQIAIELYGKGGVTKFIEEQISTLRAEDGAPLPAHAREFLLDLLFGRVRPPTSRKQLVSASLVRAHYRAFLEAHQARRSLGTMSDHTRTPSEQALHDVAVLHNLSENQVSEIIHPRAARAGTTSKRTPPSR
jgi:uncharacterized protein YjiS (DUF1127 family)